MRCYHIYDKIAGKVWIPGDCGAGWYGDESRCTCYDDVKEETKQRQKLRDEIKELQKENIKLWRIIKKLGGIDIKKEFK